MPVLQKNPRDEDCVPAQLLSTCTTKKSSIYKYININLTFNLLV